MISLISSILVASTSSYITYTTNCEYEKDCRIIFTIISAVEDIKISKFETRVNYIYNGELNNFESLLPRWLQTELVTNKHKKEQWFGDNWKRVKIRAVRQKMDITGKFGDIAPPTVFYNYANCERKVFSTIPEEGKSVARNWALFYWDDQSVSRAGFPLISGSPKAHYKYLCPEVD